jgi:ELP3 family radical SAM enzyme/protein acetyltransferase
MACLSQQQNINMDIEEILFDQDKHRSKDIYENIIVYKNMIRDIIDWIDSKKHIKNYDYLKKFNDNFSKFTHKYRIFVKKSILLFVYRNMVSNEEVDNLPLMWRFLQKRPARNLSGVTVITLLTSPYPNGQKFSCKHNCYYCPNEPDQPRSYLKKEPAVARANRNKFDPILQTQDRIKSLIVCGHEIDKLEFILEGGTYTEYPPDYLEEFHRDFIYCVNTYFDEEKREPLSIHEEILLNKTAQIKIIGICVETRPDTLIDDKGETWLRRFREWGVTRVQLGVQHTNNQILKKINRGHTVKDAFDAICYLKINGFKVDIHLMPDLPFTTPELDMKMIDDAFDETKEDSLQPDQAKIYFCAVVPWTVIQKWHQSGKYTPYAQTDEQALFRVAKYAMKRCPPWVRIPRVIRDIPLTYIEGGNMYPNLRQMLTNQLRDEGEITMDIRARECGRNTKYNPEEAVLRVRTYYANKGTEHFIAFESEDEMCLFGFLRLRIPERDEETYDMIEFECLKDVALIRELHVYGNVTPVGCKKDESQHMGFGSKMLQKAEQIAFDEGFEKIAVISGIGVMGYYEKRGYEYEDTYMIKDLTNFYNSDKMDFYEFISVLGVFLIVCALTFYLFIYRHVISNYSEI